MNQINLAFDDILLFSTFLVEIFRINIVVCNFFTFYDIIGVLRGTVPQIREGHTMNCEKVIVSTLDSFGVNRSYIGYNYVVYGLLLILEDRERLECITKSLYLDIAKHFHTSWGCVEKNIRTVVNSVWDSHNTELLEIVFNKSNRDKKPTNKEFLTYLHDHIVQVNNSAKIPGSYFPPICPISNQYCESLGLFYIRLSKILQ